MIEAWHIAYTVIGLAIAAFILFGLLLALLAAFVGYRAMKANAKAAGVDLSDGIDADEAKAILGMIKRHKQVEKAQEVAQTMSAAAQIPPIVPVDETA